MFSFLFLFVIVLAVLIPTSVYAAMSSEDQQRYPVCGSKVGTAAAAVTKFIQMKGNNALTVIVNATGGNMGSNNLVIGVSLDNTTYLTVDSIALSSATIKGISYSNALKASTVTVNPAAYPWVKVATSAGVSSVTETIYYCAGLS